MRDRCRVGQRLRRRLSGFTTLSLFGEGTEILLPALKGCDFFAGCALEIHSEPDRPNKKPSHTCYDVLSHFGAFFRTKFLKLLVIGLDFCRNACAIDLLRS